MEKKDPYVQQSQYLCMLMTSQFKEPGHQHSAAMELMFWNIPVSAPEGLSVITDSYIPCKDYFKSWILLETFSFRH